MNITKNLNFSLNLTFVNYAFSNVENIQIKKKLLKFLKFTGCNNGQCNQMVQYIQHAQPTS